MFFSDRYKCEYGPKDFSRIVKPITESLRKKPRKKATVPVAVQEGNALAPTRKARAKRTDGGQARKAPRRFKAKPGGTIIDAMDWMAGEPAKPPMKRGSRKKKITPTNQVASTGPDSQKGCLLIPDLNELPSPHESPSPPVKTVRKRASKKKPQSANVDDSVTQSPNVTAVRKKRGPYKKKTASSAPISDCSQGNGDVLDGDVANGDIAMSVQRLLATDPAPQKTARRRAPKKKAVQAVPPECLSGIIQNNDSSESMDPCMSTGVSPVQHELLSCQESDCCQTADPLPLLGSHISVDSIDSVLPSNLIHEKCSGRESQIGACLHCDTGMEDCSTEDNSGEVVNVVVPDATFPGQEATKMATTATPKPKVPRDSKKKWGQSIKRGCKAQFTVKSFLYLPHVSEITIIQEKHVNDDGLVVHGGMNVGDRSAFSAHLSPEIRAFVEDCLRRKDSPMQIMRKHLDLLKKYQAEGKDITCDLLLSTKDIRNISGKLAQEKYMLHKNDAQSVRMWVQRNPEKVFYYSESNQKKPEKVPGELTGQNMPFTIGIQTAWQKRMMLQHGHRRGISVDATFGTNDKKVIFLWNSLSFQFEMPLFFVRDDLFKLL